MMNQNKLVNIVVKLGMLSAVAVILQYAGTLMGIKVGGFLDVEISDYPAIIGALSMGPAAGVVIELIKNLIHTTITTTGFVGEFANFSVNGAFVLVVGLIYKYNRTKVGAIVALSVGVLALCAAGIVLNLYVMLPLFMQGAPFQARLNTVITLITPFNFFRGLALSALTMLTYKPLSVILHADKTTSAQ